MARTKNFQLEKKWVYLDQTKPNFESSKLSEVIVSILSSRGIKTEEEALDFLNPKYESLEDPFELKDMKKAVSLVKNAVSNNDKITVYGDYDVDGITATALLLRFFKQINAEADYYIPSRQDEGYGLNTKAVEEIAKRGTKLLITVDCGSTSIEEIELANELGLKVLVTDHHALLKDGDKDILPKADALINPRRADSSYKQELAGVGVAFYLVRSLQTYFNDKFPDGAEKWLLDLVTLGTICDVVPLICDNRILSKFGLLVLSKTKSVGIKAIADVTGFNIKDVDSYKVGFVIGPRLNAAGRIEHADKALKLLITEDPKEASILAGELNKLNIQRQELTETIIAEAKEVICGINKDQKVYVLADKNWPAGVVGIVASRLADEFGRPVLVMEETENEYKGSARSINSFNIIDALRDCSEYLKHFGGHAYAAGFRLNKENLHLLEKRLIDITNKRISEKDMIPEIVIDKRLLNKDITQEMMDEVKMLAPFGSQNYPPVMAAFNQEVIESRLVGNPQKHLKLTLKDDTGYLSGIAFNYGEEGIAERSKVDVVFAIEENEWNGRKKVEARFIDVRLNK